jgi:hypothetical protein
VREFTEALALALDQATPAGGGGSVRNG